MAELLSCLLCPAARTLQLAPEVASPFFYGDGHSVAQKARPVHWRRFQSSDGLAAESEALSNEVGRFLARIKAA